MTILDNAMLIIVSLTVLVSVIAFIYVTFVKK